MATLLALGACGGDNGGGMDASMAIDESFPTVPLASCSSGVGDSGACQFCPPGCLAGHDCGPCAALSFQYCHYGIDPGNAMAVCTCASGRWNCSGIE